MTIDAPTGLSVSVVDPCTDRAWAHLMKTDRGSLFGSPPWLRAISDVYDMPMHAAVIVDAVGQAVAGMAYAEVRDLRGSRVLSLPFCERLDPVVRDGEEWRRVVGPALERGLPVEVRILDAQPPLHDERFSTVAELTWHATALDVGDGDPMARIAPAARRNIRAAIRSGVTIRFGSASSDVEAFHALHVHTRKYKYRLLAQPLGFFEEVRSNFGDDAVVALAYHDGDVIAGMFCVAWNGVMYYKFGASLADRLAVRPNELLAWECLRLARERGERSFDWGVSDLDQPGLISYKRKFATHERRVHRLRYVPPQARSAPDMGTVLPDITELLTRDDVPDDVTRRAGELLYRYFC